jgi:hypothetical protein
MKLNEVAKKLIDNLKPELCNFGFEPSYKNQGFTKVTKDNVFLYQFLIYNRNIVNSNEKGFLVEPYLWVIVKPIEAIYKKITLNSELKSLTDYKTIGNSVAEIIANPNDIYTTRNHSLNLLIFSESDICKIAKILLYKFENNAIPYFLLNSSVKAIDVIVNSNPNEYKVHMQNDNYRVIKGVIAAKLNKNPDFENIVKVYEKQIIDRDMYNAKDEWERLKEILNQF